MRTLAVRICNVVATPDYSCPPCKLNLYNFNMTIYKAMGGSVCHVVAIGRIVCRRLSTPRCEPAEEKPLTSACKGGRVDVAGDDAGFRGPTTEVFDLL
jgi:hypothetical protein